MIRKPIVVGTVVLLALGVTTWIVLQFDFISNEATRKE
jgi:hypothetical protein